MRRLNYYKNNRLCASLDSERMSASLHTMLYQNTTPIKMKIEGAVVACVKVVEGFTFGDANLSVYVEPGDIFHLT